MSLSLPVIDPNQTWPARRGQHATHAGHALAAPHTPVHRLYIHIPFCFHKCHYCDFYSFVDSRDRQAAFTDHLRHELDALAPYAGTLLSIFIGGGTPTLLRVEHWQPLLDTLRDRFTIPATTEFTVECNPETADARLFAALVAGGVNRISIGAQSFDTRHLRTLERWHEPANVERALRLARDAGIRRRSIDLIFAIPGQTIDDWQRDLDALARLAQDGLLGHASCYALTYEPNTAMTKRLQRGDFNPVPDKLEAAMYQRTVDQLADANLRRYEVSNFAAPGLECDHNLGYWRSEQWLAAGPSASAHIAGQRWKNIPRLTDWMTTIARNNGHPAITDFEAADPRRALAERLMLGLRTRDGLHATASLADASRLDARDRLQSVINAAVERGHLERHNDRWRLTDHGFLVADSIAADLIDAVDPQPC